MERITSKEYEDFVEEMVFIAPHLVEQMAVLGIAGEAGEISDHYKKNLRGDTSTDQLKELVTKEIGDVLFYLTVLAHHHGMSLAGVMALNRDKLLSRRERDKLRGNGDER